MDGYSLLNTINQLPMDDSIVVPFSFEMIINYIHNYNIPTMYKTLE